MFQAARLAEARVRAGLTQDDLGRLVGVSRARISEWEASRTRPQARFVSRLAQALNVSAVDLMREVAEPRDLKQLRMAAGLNVYEVAAAAGTTVEHYQLLERGRSLRKLPMRGVLRLAIILAVPAADLAAAIEQSRARDPH